MKLEWTKRNGSMSSAAVISFKVYLYESKKYDFDESKAKNILTIAIESNMHRIVESLPANTSISLNLSSIIAWTESKIIFIILKR